MGRAEKERERLAALAAIEPFHAQVERFGADAVRRVIGLCNGNRTEAAKYLGIGRTTLYQILARGKRGIFTPPTADEPIQGGGSTK